MRVLLFSILALAGSTLAFASDKTPRVATQGDGATVTSANFTGGNATVRKGGIIVDIKTSKASNTPFKDGFRWGGEASEAPSTLITAVIVQSGSSRLFVPLSAYSDLGDPRMVTLKHNAAGFELAISGGDAGVSYNASLIFKDGWLIRRRVAHGEFPRQAWEETQYAYNTLDN